MISKIFNKGKNLLVEPQASVLSAAFVIMLMIVVSRVLGLARQTVLLHFFPPEQISLFFAAFRLPDSIFEVLVFGTFSSAFIPVFTKALKKDDSHAWEVAAIVVNFGLLLFLLFGICVAVFAPELYALVAPGYSEIERGQIVEITRILLVAQVFFVVSYVLTGVLESMRRFLVPAIAPIFYNLGIILGTLFLSNTMGSLAPAVGVLIGSAAHLLVQLPLAVKLGFRFRANFTPTAEVKKIARLAFPRIIETSFLQISKMVELFLASFVGTASYAYYYLGNSLQLLPVGLFGTSLAKAALPTLSDQSDDIKLFTRTLWSALYQMVFLMMPFVVILIVLKIPVVRLVYGRELFGWESTVQTSMVLSAFGASIVFQGVNAVLARSFYALHDTKTPVIASIFSMVVTILLDFVLVRELGIPVWGLAAAFSIGSAIQTIVLFGFLTQRIGRISFAQITPFIKSIIGALGSGAVMYFLLKVFDRSVWIKRLSFLGELEIARRISFERFVLDTRYTINLAVLTAFVSVVGMIVYVGLLFILRSHEPKVFYGLLKRTFIGKRVSPVPSKEEELVSPTHTETSGGM